MSINNVSKTISLIAVLTISVSLLGCKNENITTPLPSTMTFQTKPVSLATQPNSEDPIKISCAEESSRDQFSLEMNTTILMYDEEHNLSLYNLNSGEKKEFLSEPDLAPFDIIVSPNRKLAAITMLTKPQPPQASKLLLIDVAGNVIKEFVWKAEWGRIAAWVNNHQILIAKQADLQLSIYNPTNIILLDINSGEDAIIQSAYQNLNKVAILDWSLVNHTYSPDLKRVMYLTSQVGPNYNNYVALLNLENNQVLATLPIELGEVSAPQWSPDGSQILVSGLISKQEGEQSNWLGNELFTIDAVGKISQLTQFTNFYSGAITIEKYTWSPDGHNIIFWLQTDQMINPHLVTFDVSSGEIIDHCIKSLPFHAASRLIWSPLGDYILVESQGSLENISETLLINKDQNTYLKIGENVQPVGWMSSP